MIHARLRQLIQAVLLTLPISVGLSQTGNRPPTPSPRIVALRVEKCVGCQSKARRRVAVMPAKVVDLAREFGLQPEWMAAEVRGGLEQSIAQSQAFIPCDRAILDAVLAGHDLGQSLGFYQEIAPQTRRLIPAQLLLMTTLDGIHIQTSSRSEPNVAKRQKFPPRVYVTTATITLMYRVLDASSGTTVALGSLSATGTADDRQLLLEKPAVYWETAAASVFAGLVSRVLGEVTREQSEDLQRQLGIMPFRARVMKVDQDGVVLDCGANTGLSVGDAFGVRRTQAGPAAGLVRVSDVQESTAFAQVLAESGPLEPGDELEWVGVYTLNGPGAQ
jgi:hypothetical protein